MLQDKDHIIMSEELKNNVDIFSFFDGNKKSISVVLNDGNEYSIGQFSIKGNYRKNVLHLSLRIQDESFVYKNIPISKISIKLDQKVYIFDIDKIISFSFKNEILKLKLIFEFKK